MPHYDELLQSRVRQLRDIEDATRRAEDEALVMLAKFREHLRQIRRDIQMAIDQAEREHAEF